MGRCCVGRKRLCLVRKRVSSIVGGSRTYLGGAMTSRSASDRLNYFPLAAPTTSPRVGIRVCSLPNWHWVVPTHPLILS